MKRKIYTYENYLIITIANTRRVRASLSFKNRPNFQISMCALVNGNKRKKIILKVIKKFIKMDKGNFIVKKINKREIYPLYQLNTAIIDNHNN